MGRAAGCCAVVAVLACTTACGGGDDGSPRSPRPVAPAAGLPSVALRKTYVFEGRTRRVRARMTARPFTAPIRDPSMVVPAGRRPFRVAVTVTDQTRDRFPFAWTRFSLAGRRGRVVDGYQFTPLRKLEVGRRVGGSRMTILTFFVPRGFEPRELRLRSIVQVWSFRGRWAVGGR